MTKFLKASSASDIWCSRASLIADCTVCRVAGARQEAGSSLLPYAMGFRELCLDKYSVGSGMTARSGQFSDKAEHRMIPGSKLAYEGYQI